MSSGSPFKSIGLLALFLLTKQLDFTNANVMRAVYTIFCAVHIAICVVLFEMHRRILKKHDKSTLSYHKKYQQNFMNVKSAAVTTTVFEYDQEKFVELAVKRLAVGVAILGLVHYKWGVIPPLLYQCIHNPMTVYDSPLFQIYMLGEKAIGELKRPFTENNPIMKFAEGVEVPASSKKKE
ncbi:phosphate transporter protein [Perkinsela sp. CCAP 1560/4]|nr:phosphate transporter protein [Perkinsela sp. CCAP 1560/4]|eukprot:KNH06951.1 phosphate transporter protein [Perkinsela sp. CCAP 1560/4]